jgi:hypothetical protein
MNRIGTSVWVMAVFFAAMMFQSCHVFRKAEEPKVKEPRNTREDRSAPDLQQLIRENAFKAGTISAKASVKTEGGQQEGSFNITLRLQTDTMIWISISPMLGIEVARILATRDSVKFMDRLNNKYALADYQFLSQMLDVNVDFDILQGVLTGNLFAYRKNKFNSVYVEDSCYILSTMSKRKLKRSLEDVDITKPVVQDVWVEDSTFRITRLSIEDLRVQKSLLTDYFDYRQTDAGLFPFKSSTMVKAGQQMRISIEYDKVSVNNALEFPFTIPKGYEKIR